MLSWTHLRKSRHLGDPDDPRLLATHRSILAALAASDGAVIPPEHVIEEIESGEFLAQRPAFLAWLESVERLPEGAGGVLYCMAFDRLSRGDPLERARVRVALRRAGIRIRTPSGWIDLSDPDQALLAGVRSELAEHELARFKERIMRARREKLRRGEVLCGSAPFGYTWSKDKQRPVPDPETFPILKACCREIFSTSVLGLSRRYGVHASILQRAMHNPAICGWAAKRHGVRLSITGRRYPLPLPRSQWVWAEEPGDWEAACSRAEWEAIQQILSARRNRTEWTEAVDGWCRDVVKFEGAPAGAWIRLQTGGVLPAYFLIDPERKKPLSYVGRAAVHTVVTQALLPILADADVLARALAAAAARYVEEAAATPAAALSDRVARARQELEQLVRAGLAEGGEELRRARAVVQRELESEIRDLLRTLQQREAQAAAARPLPDFAGLLPELEDTARSWELFSPAAKRALVNALIVSVPVKVEKVPGHHPLRTVFAPVWHPDLDL